MPRRPLVATVGTLAGGRFGTASAVLPGYASGHLSNNIFILPCRTQRPCSQKRDHQSHRTGRIWSSSFPRSSCGRFCIPFFDMF